MKIGVLTFHSCINYGSYWQANCLVRGLQQRGHDVVILDHRSAKVNRAEWRCALKPIPASPADGEDRLLYARKARRFFEAFKALPLSQPFAIDRPEDIEDVDLIVVGSDEVWNLRHPWYGGCPLFYGEGFSATRLTSYAASFGNYAFGNGLAGAWAEKLRRFSAISIRDENSRTLVRQAIDSEPTLVLDPCLQYPPAMPREPNDAGRPYVAVYGHTFPEWFSNAVREWAAPRGLRLVSIGYRNLWAGEQFITAGPREFARVMAGARAVVTNFFHGCVFAFLNQKPFVCATSDYRSTKVTDLTNSLNAERHLVSEGTSLSHYADVLDSELQGQISDRITSLRRQSDAYLDAALN
jgi:hypothetical protein